MTDVWEKWEGRLVNGLYPLRRFLGNSDHSVVFLTEYRPLDVSAAAIKLVPADPQLATGQLARWRTLRSLSHPHLLKLFDSGHCQIGGHPFFFVVMEYADQTLAQVLPQRPLTVDEVRELLPPTLDALEYLHPRGLAHGQVKPENILVVGDQVKLANDTIRPAEEAIPKGYKATAYDPPEVRNGRSSVAVDTWGLGVTLIQALTQTLPDTSGGHLESVSLPGEVSQGFADTIRRCLSSEPAQRPALSDLRSTLEAPSRPSPILKAPLPAAPFDTRLLKHPAVIAGGAALVLLLAWLGLRGSGHHSPATPPEATPAPLPNSAAARPEDPAQVSRAAAAPAASATSAVLHQQLPSVSRSAQASIHGHFKVTVRVNVDATGNVVAAVLQDAGPSKYFSRSAVDAAKQWKFSPAADSTRVWLLQFDFSREKLTARASPKT